MHIFISEFSQGNVERKVNNRQIKKISYEIVTLIKYILWYDPLSNLWEINRIVRNEGSKPA